MTPIELAARAIEPAAFREPDTSVLMDAERLATRQRLAIKRARAVLAAIREPSSDMQYAVGGGSEDDLVNNPHDAYLIWQAMIDAALAEEA
jgi:hypothetical protein